MSDALDHAPSSEVASGPSRGHRLFGVRSLKRNAVANLVGQASPLVVALFAVPMLTRELGTDRFGILTLAWAVLGYFSLFDLGLGRAVTKLVAEKIGSGDLEAIPQLVWTSLILMTGLGLIGTLVILSISSWLVHESLKIPIPLQLESAHSFNLLALSIPVVTATVGLRGVLEATQRFDLINLVRIPLGAFTFLGPLAVLPFTHDLEAVVAVLLLGRMVGLLAHLLLCFRVIPRFRVRPILNQASIGPLLRFGGWITVSNVISPIMVSLDRFVIGAMISVAAVAYYTAPYEAVTKLWMIPASLTGVLFPAFASTWARDQARATRLFTQGTKYTFLLIFPVMLVIVGLGHEGLALWLGRDYAEHSTRVLQWLALGVLLNCVAQMPSALIQALGRPDLTAKLHLFELPCYLVGLWLLIRGFGIEGAAIAWASRCGVDCVALLLVARHFISARQLPLKGLLSAIGVLTCSLALILVHWSFPLRIALLSIALLIFVVFTWFGLLSHEERVTWRSYARL